MRRLKRWFVCRTPEYIHLKVFLARNISHRIKEESQVSTPPLRTLCSCIRGGHSHRSGVNAVRRNRMIRVNEALSSQQIFQPPAHARKVKCFLVDCRQPHLCISQGFTHGSRRLTSHLTDRDTMFKIFFLRDLRCSFTLCLITLVRKSHHLPLLLPIRNRDFLYNPTSNAFLGFKEVGWLLFLLEHIPSIDAALRPISSLHHLAQHFP